MYVYTGKNTRRLLGRQKTEKRLIYNKRLGSEYIYIYT